MKYFNGLGLVVTALSAAVSITSARPEVTVAILSCKRPDLLRKTLSNFTTLNTYPISDWLILDCDDDVRQLDVARSFKPFRQVQAEPFKNREHNIMCNIQRLYDAAKTDYVFFSEDDWSMLRSGFISKALFILNGPMSENVTQVLATPGPTGPDPERPSGSSRWHFSRCPLWKNGGFGAWSNHPHLSYKPKIFADVGSLCDYGHEAAVTKKGYGGGTGKCKRAFVHLYEQYSEHLGGSRSVNSGK